MSGKHRSLKHEEEDRWRGENEGRVRGREGETQKEGGEIERKNERETGRGTQNEREKRKREGGYRIAAAFIIGFDEVPGHERQRQRKVR